MTRMRCSHRAVLLPLTAARALALALTLTLVLAAAACRDDAAAGRGAAQPGVAELLRGTDDTGFARATQRPELQFPRDHGAHPDHRTEWWYVTANVATAAGRRFGMQLVFFRQGMAAPGAAPARAATLAAREVVLAHAAVTDVDGERFHAEERIARHVAGLAAVSVAPTPAQPFAVHCGDWSAAAESGGDGFLPLRLRASGRDFGFDLRLSPGEPVVLQGDAGLSRKSDEPGNASIYYSIPRLPIGGSITVDGSAHAVRGEAWLDREWSTSALARDQVGWDWFSLQLDDGSELMWYQLRARDGSIEPWSRGCAVAADGVATVLGRDAVEAIPDGTWTAADGNARYPARWRLRGAGAARGGADSFELEITPLLADQELRLMVRYWEGAVVVRGTRAGRPVTGRGYLEMTGYAEPR